MRILLISPPFYRIIGFYNRYFPIGVVALGTVLKKADHEVLVYDADYYKNPTSIDYSQLPDKYPIYLESFNNQGHPIWNEVRQTILKFRPDLVGISVFTTFAASAFHTATIVKELFPSCLVVMGGPHATAKSDEILKISPHIDFVIRGEGEKTLINLVDSLTKAVPKLSSIEGLSYRDGSIIKHNSTRMMIRDLDAFPIPDRTLLLNEKEYASEDMGLIMTSRGCPYNCSYCASTKGVSYRSIDNVLEEIALVKEKYGTTQFTFKDDSFTVSKERVKKLCDKIIEKKLKISWECNTRVDLINEDLLRIMKKAGCNFIKIGIESGSEKMLKKMNKGITLNESRKAAKLLRKVGIHWTGYFLMGIIGETVEDVYKTLNFMLELRPNLALIGVYEPFPGTAMFAEGLKLGLVKEKMNLSDFYKTLPNDYYKKDPLIQNDGIEKEAFDKLEKEIKEEFHKYNTKISNVLKTAISKYRTYLKEPAVFWADIKKYLNY